MTSDSALFPSDAPTRSELVSLPAGGRGLRRTLDDLWLRDEDARFAFRAEMETAARLPGGPRSALARIVGAGEQPFPWLVREFSDAGTLRDRLRLGPPFEPGEIVTVLSRTLSALDELRGLGLSHGDPSTGNLLVFPDGDVRLADPMSGRRLFAEGSRAASAAPARSADGRILRTWLRSAARSAAFATRSSYGSDLVALLESTGKEDGETHALWEWCSRNSGHARPVASPATTPSTEGPATVAPVEVVLTIGPVRDSKTRYLATKVLLPRTGRTASDLATELEKFGLAFNIEFPDPARALEKELRTLGLPVHIRSFSPLPAGRTRDADAGKPGV